jgi:short subunit dehydrogenase-like uncharacterized protein
MVPLVTTVLYGATGYTGGLVADELARRGIDHILSGRHASRVARLGEERGVPARAAALDEERGLRELLAEATAVINCAGPFTVAGDALVRAALDTGTHYADSTGEQAFIRMVFERHGAAAEAAGVALVPALGFDYAPGDCIARLAARGREPLAELLIAYSVERFAMSRGTLRSALEIMKGDDVVYEEGGWRPAPGGVFRGGFDFPEPTGHQAMTRFASGEVITAPRHTRTRKVVSLLTARAAAPHPALAPIVPYTLPALALALRTPLRPVLGRALRLLPEGPRLDARRATEFTIVALARGEDGRTGRGVVRGSDVYGLTAAALAHGAELLGAPGYDRAGALGPAAAFDPQAFLDHLARNRLSWEVGAATAAA